MKRLLPIISLLGLVCVIGPPIAYLIDAVEKDAMTNLMLLGTIVWFVTVPLWMGRHSEEPAD